MTAAADLTPQPAINRSADAESKIDEPTEAELAVSAPVAAQPPAADGSAADGIRADAAAGAEAELDVSVQAAVYEPAGAESLDDESVDAEPLDAGSSAVEPADADSDPADEDPTDASPLADEPQPADTSAVPAEPSDAERADDELADSTPSDDELAADEVDQPVEDAPAEAVVADEGAASMPADAAPAADDTAEVESADHAEAAATAAAVPAPSVLAGRVPAPVPGRPRIPVAAATAAPAPATDAEPAAASESANAESGTVEPWGRVDDDGTVSVREPDGWRVVGQYPDGSPEEALAYFERKYADLASEVGLLEVRHHRGGASAADLRSAARAVNAKLDGAAAVGDLASLAARVAALTASLAAASETEAAAAREAVDEAVRTRTQLVEKVEAIAARDPRTVQWKQASTDVSTLFDQWQSDQQNGPRLPKAVAQQLWKRFRDARATFDKHRREFYAELDEAHKGVRDRKTRLVEKAEALAPKGEDGIPAYRELLDEWKTAGRAGKKVDDALWARFKAAGDALYSARIERETADAEASREKIEAKRALLVEARAIADEREIVKARTVLTGIQRHWDEIGRILPRESERSLDDELRRIELGLRTREEADWKRNNPETKARANEMTRQLTEAIHKLEEELAAAQKSGDKAAIAKAAEALEARRSWLNALGG